MLNFYVGQKFGEKGTFTAVITAIDGDYVNYEYTYVSTHNKEVHKSGITVRSLDSWLAYTDNGRRWHDLDRVVVVIDPID